MSTIDNRVVSMTFDNAGFNRGAQSTISMLDRLKQALHFSGGSNGIDQAARSLNGFRLDGIANAVESVNNKFSTLGLTAVGVLTNIANRAVSAGTSLVRSLTLDPIMEGFGEYETKLGSIQTIYSNTHEKYGTSIGTIEGELEKLNKYADKTIYSFGDMTRNIGLFTNAGLSVEDSTSMIKGFSNAAAASGTNAQSAAGAAYQLSQGLSKGKITLEDWNSLTNAGMGNANMKEGLVDIAHAMGTLDKSTMSTKEAVGKEFRDSLQDGWVTSEVMSTYLRIMSGDMDEAAMSALGLSKEQVKSFSSQQKIAEEAATKVRTFTQMMGTLKEAVGSGWAQTFETVFGGFEGATELFTNVTEAISGILDASSDARNKLLKDWADLGGREALFKGISNIFNNLKNIFAAVHDAFREVFPPMTGQQLTTISKLFLRLTEILWLNDRPLEMIHNLFKILFTVIRIGVDVVVGFLKLFTGMSITIPKVNTGISGLVQKVADAVTGFRNWLNEGDKLGNFFATIGRHIAAFGKYLLIPIGLLAKLGKLIMDAFGRIDLSKVFGGITDAFKGFVNSFDGFLPMMQKVGHFLGEIARVVGGALVKAFNFAGEKIGAFMKKLSDAFNSDTYSKILDGINTGLLAGFVLMFKKFLGGGSLVEQIKDAMFGGKDGGKKKSLIEQAKELILGDGEELGIIEKAKEAITGVFDSLTETLTAMQTNLKAGALIKIAGAIGIMTASVVALSMLDGAKLTKALTAMTAMFMQLGGAMLFFERVGGWAGALRLGPLAIGLGLLAGAMLVLSASIVVLSKLSWKELAAGLTGVTGGLAALAGSAKVLAGSSKGLISAGLGLTILASAMLVLSVSIEKLSALSWDELGRGLSSVAGGIVLLSASGRVLAGHAKGLVTAGLGLTVIASAMLVLSASIEKLSKLSWEEIGRGLSGVAGGIVLLTASARVLAGNSQGLISAGIGLTIMASAIALLTMSIEKLAGLSWEELGKGLGGVTAGLVGLTASARILSGNAQGLITAGIGLNIIAAAIAVLTQSIKALAELSWDELGRGLSGVAGGIVLLTAAGRILSGNSAGIITASIGLMGLSVSIGILAKSLLLLSGISWEEIGKGLTGVGGILAALLLFTKFAAIEKVGVTTGIGLMALAGGIAALAMALNLIAGMDLVNMGISLAGTTAGIAGLGLAMQLIPNDIAIKAAGLVILAGALAALGGAMTIMGGLGWEEIGKGLTAIGGSMAILAVGLNVMAGTLAGSMALTIAAGALTLLVPVLAALGVLPWPVILTSLGTLALTFGLLGGAALLLAPVIPAILGLAGAITLLGVGLGAVLISLAAFVASIGLLTASIAALAAVGTPALLGLIATFPLLAQAVGNAIISILGVIAANGQAIVNTIVTIVSSVLTAITNLVPQIINTVVTVGMAVLTAIQTLAPQIISTVQTILSGLLNMIISMTPQIVQAFIVIMQGLLNAVVTLTPQIVQTIITLCQGILNAIAQMTPSIVQTGCQMVMDLVNGIVGLVPQLVDAGMKIVIGFLDGVAQNIGAVVDKGTDIIVNFLEGIQRNAPRIAQEGADTVITFINSVANAIRNNSAALREAGMNLAGAIVDGMTGGLASKAGNVVAAASELANKIPGKVKSLLGIHSPSRVMKALGKFTVMGLRDGIAHNEGMATGAASTAAQNVKDAVLNRLSNLDVGAEVDLNPTIRPVVDMSEVRNGFASIGNNVPTIGVSTQSLGEGVQNSSNNPANNTGETVTAGTTINFTQNNTSPKALSDIDIYRNTKNTLSLVKKGAFV